MLLRTAFLLLAVASPALAQTAGTINLAGPSTSPGAPVITPAAINAAVNAALANKQDCCVQGGTGAGGFPSFIATNNVTGNFQIGTLPANSFIGPFLLIKETAGNAGTFALGTTAGGTDVLPAQSFLANGSLTIGIATFTKTFFSATVSQPIYITQTGAGAKINAQLFYAVEGTSGGGGGGGIGTVTSIGLSTPASTLSVGGTNPVTGFGTISVDLNLTHANTWTGQQTFVSPVVTGSFTATGLVTNASLATPSTTVNGITCTLGSACTIATSMLALPSAQVYQGNGSGIAAPVTLSAAIDAALGSTQGNVLFRGGSAWQVLAPGTNGFFLESQGASANPVWAAAPTATGCTVGAGTSGQLLTNNGASGCATDANASAVAGALTLGATGVAGSIVMGNATSGTVTLSPVTGALGTVTASLPANTGTIAETNLAQSWTAPQRTNTEVPTIAATTFTPIFSTAQNHRINFPAATCTCTIANPAAIVAGQSGMIELVQGATSASLNPTWGSQYKYPGGTTSIVLSTGLNAVDYIPYYVDSNGTSIILGSVLQGPVH